MRSGLALGLALTAIEGIPSGSAVAATLGAAGTRHCRADPSAAIATGGVWNGGGRCYTVRDGLTITTPVRVENALFYDPQSRPHRGSVHPIIRIKDTSEVTLSSLALVGANTSGAFHADMVGEAGIDILSSDAVTVSDVTTTATFGDGLTLGFQPFSSPSWNIVVNGLTVTDAGRDGITMASVNIAAMVDVDVVSSAMSGWDFESDLPGVGSGNVLVEGATGRGIRFVEALSGPVTFDDSFISGSVTLLDAAATSGESVTFNDSTVLLKGTFQGTRPLASGSGGPAISPSTTSPLVGKPRKGRPMDRPGWQSTGPT
jgi:hypothetical protein